MKRWFWVLDVAVVMSFTILGAVDHGFTIDFAGTMRVAAPFLVALAGGVTVLRAWRNPLSILTGILLAFITLAGGMLLRHYLWDEGTARIFIIVTSAYIITMMVGWRLIALSVRWFRNRY